MYKEWCKFNLVERQANEPVSHAWVFDAASPRRVRTGGQRRPTSGTIPVQTFAEINGFWGASTVPPALHEFINNAGLRPGGTYDNRQILEGLENAYKAAKKGDVWKVAKAWLNSRGIR